MKRERPGGATVGVADDFGVSMWPHGLVALAAGLALAIVLVGPLLGPGDIFTLDFFTAPDAEVGPAIWGLGPELPRATPFSEIVTVTAGVIGDWPAWRGIIVASVVAAYVGMFRLAPVPGPIHRHLGALLYAGGPFLMTRLSVGHISMVAALGVLPWVARDLLGARGLRRLVLGSFALALTGAYGGLLAGLVVVWGALADARRLVGPRQRVFEVARRAMAWLVVQFVWLVPGTVLLSTSPDVGDAGLFPSGLDGPADVLRLVVGQGFWQQPFQVGAQQPLVLTVVLAVAVLGPALVAQRSRRSPSWLAGLLWPALATMALVLLDALPVTSDLYATLTDVGPLRVLREPQRYLALFHLWLAPSAAVGAAVLDDRLGSSLRSGVGVAVLAAAVALSAPGWWGAAGRIGTGEYPAAWYTAREIVADEPGPVVALPWARYLSLSFADGRRVLNPVPAFFGGDVLASGDLGLGEGTSERIDGRQDDIDRLVGAAEIGEAVSADLAALGVRWVLVLREAGYARYDGLADDPGLRPEITDTALTLYRVESWRPSVDANGSPYEVDEIVPPLVRVTTDAGIDHPPDGRSGWLRGWSTVHASVDDVDGATRWLWYWPGLLVLGGHVLSVGVVLACAVRGFRASAGPDAGDGARSQRATSRIARAERGA